MHSPSRVQIPPSPLPAPGFHWNPGVSCVPVPPARVRAPGSVGLKDKTCWFCGDFSACWCGKVGIEGGGSQLGGWTKRVGFVATFRLAGAGKATLKVVVSSWGYEYPQMPGVWANNWPGTDTRRQLGSSPRGASYLRSSPRAWARSCARGPSNSHANPLMRAWAAPPRHGIAGLRAK